MFGLLTVDDDDATKDVNSGGGAADGSGVDGPSIGTPEASRNSSEAILSISEDDFEREGESGGGVAISTRSL